ncbi:conserved hypothetical protein [Ricinus communis]|uniref:Uncharacterized protein n=1 Tax=Ricinus communis TaxID=3988 RepID=B9RVV1_RICCO|nr:conserved hypothetical protein [Ricinus communis]
MPLASLRTSQSILQAGTIYLSDRDPSNDRLSLNVHSCACGHSTRISRVYDNQAEQQCFHLPEPQRASKSTSHPFSGRSSKWQTSR